MTDWLRNRCGHRHPLQIPSLDVSSEGKSHMDPVENAILNLPNPFDDFSYLIWQHGKGEITTKGYFFIIWLLTGMKYKSWYHGF